MSNAGFQVAASASQCCVSRPLSDGRGLPQGFPFSKRNPLLFPLSGSPMSLSAVSAPPHGPGRHQRGHSRSGGILFGRIVPVFRLWVAAAPGRRPITPKIGRQLLFSQRIWQ